MNTRQYRLLGLCAVLGLLVLYYLSNGSSGGAAGPKIDLDSPEEKLKIENYKKAMRDLALQFDPAGEDGARADVYQALLSKQATATATDVAGLPTPAAVAPGAAADEPAFPELQPSDKDADSENPLKAPPIPEDKSIGGRKKSSDGKVVPNRPDTGDEKADASTGGDEEKSMEAELSDILAKRGPVVVFSKTMCPYSKKAKVSRQEHTSRSLPPISLLRAFHIFLNHVSTAHPPGLLHHRPSAIRCRNRPTSPRTRAPSGPRDPHRSTDRPQRLHQRQIHRRRR